MRQVKRLVLAFASLVFFAACASDNLSANDDPPASPEATRIQPTSGLQTLTVEGTKRFYQLFVPSTLDPATPTPLVLNLHGAGSSGLEQQTESGFDDVAEEVGVVVAYPNASGSFSFEDSTDVDFLASIISALEEVISIDASRTYAIGMSQGGDFLASLPCRDPGRYAAIVSIAVLNHHDSPICPSPEAVSILGVVGTNDSIYSIESGLLLDVLDPAPPGPLADEVAGWIGTNDCQVDPTVTAPFAGVERRDYLCVRSSLSVVIHGGGHQWPTGGSDSFDVNRIIWDFLTSTA